jgi:NAD(P)-dependent dehydrogenase (short-subunit alcohol dehydrogenase family)
MDQTWARRIRRFGIALPFAMIALAWRERRRIGLRGKVALVIGGSRGLGLLVAKELVRRGAKVAIAARDGAELARAIDTLGGDVRAFPCDVRDHEEVAGLVRRVESTLGAIELLFNVAGVMEVGPVEAMRTNDFGDAMATHFWGPMFAARAVLPSMRRHGRGRIVNVSSIGGAVSAPHLLPHSASKFALRGFSEGLAAEVRRDGIYVTTVLPGFMRTGSQRHAMFKGDHRKEHAWFTIADSLPLLSMSADRAARRIVRAGCRGEATVVLSALAKVVAVVHGIAPSLVVEVNALLARLLPRGTSPIGRLGSASTNAWAPSFLTVLDQRAALRNNE